MEELQIEGQRYRLNGDTWEVRNPDTVSPEWSPVAEHTIQPFLYHIRRLNRVVDAVVPLADAVGAWIASGQDEHAAIVVEDTYQITAERIAALTALKEKVEKYADNIH